MHGLSHLFKSGKGPDIQQMKQQRDVKALVAALQAKQPGTRAVAVEALAALVPVLENEGNISALFEALQAHEAATRTAAAAALSRLGDPRGMDFLLEALRAKADTKLALSAAVVLDGFRDRRGRDFLISQIEAQRDHETVQMDSLYAALALAGLLHDRRGLSFITEQLNHENARRVKIVEMFIKVGGWLHVLTDALNDKDEHVRETARKALKRLGETPADVVASPAGSPLSEAGQGADGISANSDSDMVAVLDALCRAYVRNDPTEIALLESKATRVGEALNRRGGIQEMRRVFALVRPQTGKRTLEMHWHGIGEWRG
jgi:HEAT repeat protein